MQNAHTRKTAYTFFCILQLIYKENRTDGFSKPNRNRTELEKSILHIPSKRNLKAYLSEDLLVFKEIDEVGFYVCIGFVYRER